MNENNFISCPTCGNPKCNAEDTFCFNCGNPIQNKCSNPMCSWSEKENRSLPLNYCFCPECGSETTLMQSGHIKPQAFNS